MIEKKSPPTYLVILSLLGFFALVSIILTYSKKQRAIANQELQEKSKFMEKMYSLIEAKDSALLAEHLKKISPKWQNEYFEEMFLSKAIKSNSLAILKLGEKYHLNVLKPYQVRRQLQNSLNVFYSTGNWLHFAAANKCEVDMIKYLIKKGVSKKEKVKCTRASSANPNIGNQEGCPSMNKTPLDLAIENKADSLVIVALK
jgi:Tfp pilus assembly protein PilE